METRPELLLLQKSMVVIEGVTRELKPDINIWELSKPLVSSWAMEHLGPKGKTQRLLAETKHHVHAWMKLPEDINAHLEQLQHRLPQRSKGSIGLLLPPVFVLAGGVTMGLNWTQPVESAAFLLAAGLITFGLWLQWVNR